MSREYPSVKKGAIVSSSNPAATLGQSLGQLGLTAGEKADMLSYWLPELQATKSPYYRISFLQTAEMNKIVPMKITPNPYSLLRVFLDWAPLQTKPAESLPPQEFTPFARNGFAVVEWGGLKYGAE